MNISKKNIFAYQTIEYLKDFGTPERLQKVKHDVKKRFDKLLMFKKKNLLFLLIEMECLIKNLALQLIH